MSCQVMADMKKVYDHLIIINLYQQLAYVQSLKKRSSGKTKGKWSWFNGCSHEIMNAHTWWCYLMIRPNRDVEKTDNYLPIYYVLPSSLKTTFGGCWLRSIIGEGTLIWTSII